MSDINSHRDRGPVYATLMGLRDRFRTGTAGVRLDASSRIDGKTCLVTGGNRGLGLAIATQLATRGARVLIASRSDPADALEQIRRVSGNTDVHALRVDLAHMASVHALADALRDAGERLDVLVLNAAVVPLASRQSEDGLDLMVQVNYLANVMLVERVLKDGVLPRSEGEAPCARLVFVNSEAHRFAKGIDIPAVGRYETYPTGEVIVRYGASKLLALSYAMDLARRLRRADGTSEVCVTAVCPGAVNSHLAREAPWWSKPLLWLVMGLFFQSPRKAAGPVLWLCCAPASEVATGTYLHMRAPKEPAEAAIDPVTASALHAASERVLEDLSRRGHG